VPRRIDHTGTSKKAGGSEFGWRGSYGKKEGCAIERRTEERAFLKGEGIWGRLFVSGTRKERDQGVISRSIFQVGLISEHEGNTEEKMEGKTEWHC